MLKYLLGTDSGIQGDELGASEALTAVAEAGERVPGATLVTDGVSDVGDMPEDAPRQEDTAHAASPPHRSSTGSDNRAAMVSQ